MTLLTPPPDVEALALATLQDLGGIKVWAYDSAPGQHAITEATSLQIDVRASAKQKARDRAYAARSRLLALPGSAWDAGVVHRVDEVSGPMWVPDQDGAPRYVLRVTLHYRARLSTT